MSIIRRYLCLGVFVIATWVAMSKPAHAQYWCEYLPNGSPICMPPPMDDWERCPLCPNPGIIKLTSDQSSIAEAAKLAEQLGKTLEEYNKFMKSLGNAVDAYQGPNDNDPIPSDAMALIIANAAKYTHSDRALIHLDLSAQDMQDPRKVQKAIIRTYFTQNPNPSITEVLEIRQRRKQALGRAVLLTLSKAKAVETLGVTRPDEKLPHPYEMIRLFTVEAQKATTFRRQAKLIGAGLRMEQSMQIVMGDLLATWQQMRELVTLQSMPVTMGPVLIAVDDVPPPDPYGNYNNVNNRVYDNGPNGNPSAFPDPQPGSVQHMLRQNMIERLQVPMPAASSGQNQTRHLAPDQVQILASYDLPQQKIIRNNTTVIGPGADGYCPPDPNNPHQVDFSPQALDRLARLGNVSRCTAYTEKGYSGKQPGEALFNTPAHRAQQIADLHNIIKDVQEYQRIMKNYDDVVQCANWSNLQAEHFWLRVTQVLGNAPYPADRIGELKPILMTAMETSVQQLNGGVPMDYNYRTVDMPTLNRYAAATLGRFRHMGQAACAIADRIMTTPAQFLDLGPPGSRNCVPRPIATADTDGNGSKDKTFYSFCLGNDYPQGQRMSLAPAAIPDDDRRQKSFIGGDPNPYYMKVLPGDECVIPTSFRGAVANPPIGALAKWYQAEKIADKWYEDSCGWRRDEAGVCGTKPDTLSAQTARDDANRQIMEMNEKFWAMVQGLNDADDRLAYEQNPTLNNFGETAFLSPYVPERDLRTEQGRNNARAAIAEHVQRLRADLSGRRTAIDRALIDATALGRDNVGSQLYAEWLRRTQANSAVAKQGLENLLTFAAQTENPEWHRCELGFGVDITNLPTNVINQNGEIGLQDTNFNPNAPVPRYEDEPQPLLRENYAPITPLCPPVVREEYLCLNKPFTPRNGVYFTPSMLDGFAP